MTLYYYFPSLSEEQEAGLRNQGLTITTSLEHAGKKYGASTSARLWDTTEPVPEPDIAYSRVTCREVVAGDKLPQGHGMPHRDTDAGFCIYTTYHAGCLVQFINIFGKNLTAVYRIYEDIRKLRIKNAAVYEFSEYAG